MSIKDYHYNTLKAQLGLAEEVYTMRIGSSKCINITREQLAQIVKIFEPTKYYRVIGHYPNENGFTMSSEVVTVKTEAEAEAVVARHKVPYAQETYTIEEVTYNA